MAQIYAINLNNIMWTLKQSVVTNSYWETKVACPEPIKWPNGWKWVICRQIALLRKQLTMIKVMFCSSSDFQDCKNRIFPHFHSNLKMSDRDFSPVLLCSWLYNGTTSYLFYPLGHIYLSQLPLESYVLFPWIGCYNQKPFHRLSSATEEFLL